MPVLDLIVRFWRLALVLAAALVLSACQESGIPKDQKPVPAKLTAKMEQLNMSLRAPIYIRAFKESSEFEIWKQQSDGRYALLETYSICKWSGKLGPKIKEGDRQAPEGFYTITPAQMNPKSSYYLSFNIGFPNAFDRALGRTGSNLMVHGACSSAGCYSMTDEAAGEIYALARDAFLGGQRSFEVHLYPFRMTPENMAKHRNDPNFDFWVMLKEGNDNFEVTRKVPVVQVCGKRYVFNVDAGGMPLQASQPCPPYTVPQWLDAAVKQKQAKDNAAFQLASVKYQADDQAAAAKAAAEAAKQAEADQLAAAKAAGEAAPEAIPEAVPAATGGVVSEPPVAEGMAVVVVEGIPAPGVPLPVPSPIRPVSAPAAEPPPPQQNILQKFKFKMPWG